MFVSPSASLVSAAIATNASAPPASVAVAVALHRASASSTMVGISVALVRRRLRPHLPWPLSPALVAVAAGPPLSSSSPHSSPASALVAALTRCGYLGRGPRPRWPPPPPLWFSSSPVACIHHGNRRHSRMCILRPSPSPTSAAAAALICGRLVRHCHRRLTVACVHCNHRLGLRPPWPLSSHASTAAAALVCISHAAIVIIVACVCVVVASPLSSASATLVHRGSHYRRRRHLSPTVFATLIHRGCRHGLHPSWPQQGKRRREEKEKVTNRWNQTGKEG